MINIILILILILLCLYGLYMLIVIYKKIKKPKTIDSIEKNKHLMDIKAENTGSFEFFEQVKNLE